MRSRTIVLGLGAIAASIAWSIPGCGSSEETPSNGVDGTGGAAGSGGSTGGVGGLSGAGGAKDAGGGPGGATDAGGGAGGSKDASSDGQVETGAGDGAGGAAGGDGSTDGSGGSAGSGGTSDAGGTGGSGGAADSGGADAGFPVTASGVPEFTMIVTIVLENHSAADIIGSSSAPYLNNTVLPKAAYASEYYDSNVHPSLPNYLYMVSGSTWSVTSDVDPTGAFGLTLDSKLHIADLLEAKGVSWKAYMDGMPAPCGLSGSGAYAPKHNPFVYFKDVNTDSARCAAHDVPLSSLAGDLANPPRYVFIAPDLCHDGHDSCTPEFNGVKQLDNWIAANLDPILNSAAYKAGGVVFITFDEGSTSFVILYDDHIPMFMLSPLAKPGYKSTTHYTHANYLATVEDALGVARLGASAGIPVMSEFFKP